MLKTTVLPKVTVSSDEVTRQRTEITLMSYDKNVHQIKIPTDLTEGEINRVLVIFTYPFDESVTQLNGAWVDGHIQFTLPEILRTRRGDFYIEVNIDLIDSQITFARYRAKVVKSDIDANANHVASVYFELFEDFVNELADNAQQAKDVIDAQTTGVEGHANTSKQSMDSDVNSVHDYSVSAKATIDVKVDSVELAKTDALTAIDSDVASVDTYAIGAKSNVDGLVSNATTAIDAKVANVELAKNQALSDIADKQQDVTDTTVQFKADLSDTQTTIDNQVTQAQDSLQEVSDTLTAVNDKVSTVNDTADTFMSDVVDKSQLVDDKYQQFDDNVAAANGDFEAILGLVENVDVKIRNEIVNGDFSQGLGEQVPTSFNRWLRVENKHSLTVVDGALLIDFTNKEGVETSRYLCAWYPKISYKNNNTYYAYANILKVESGDLSNLMFVVSASVPVVIIYVREKLKIGLNSGVFNDITNGYRGYVGISSMFDKPFSAKHSCVIQNFGVINLTQTFGVGNEPTKSEMDELIKVLGGWFDGEITLTQKQQLTWLLNLIRKNTMTITTLGGTNV